MTHIGWLAVHALQLADPTMRGTWVAVAGKRAGMVAEWLFQGGAP